MSFLYPWPRPKAAQNLEGGPGAQRKPQGDPLILTQERARDSQHFERVEGNPLFFFLFPFSQAPVGPAGT